jgi:hypothetical protein
MVPSPVEKDPTFMDTLRKKIDYSNTKGRLSHKAAIPVMPCNPVIA